MAGEEKAGEPGSLWILQGALWLPSPGVGGGRRKEWGGCELPQHACTCVCHAGLLPAHGILSRPQRGVGVLCVHIHTELVASASSEVSLPC